jgi:hypothetical protein
MSVFRDQRDPTFPKSPESVVICAFDLGSTALQTGPRRLAAS